MRKWVFSLLLLLALPAFAQNTAAIQNHCYLGGTKALLSGLSSTNYQLGVVPACTVTVYFTGTQNKATIFADSISTPLSNPFTANVAGSLNPGGWLFWATEGQGYDVVLSGGGGNPNCTTAPNCYTSPITMTDLFPGGGIGSEPFSGTTTANEGVGTTGVNNTLSPVAETGYETVNGVTTYTCQEDHAKGIWDVRCHGWAANPSQGLKNTIQLAMCYRFSPPAPFVAGITPHVEIPSGSYHLGGNISIPPGLDLEGVGGTEFGSLSQLTTIDTTQPMMTQVSSETFTCNGTVFTASGNGATIGNLELVGGGTAANTDIGLANAAVSDYIHNITFTGFGGPGRTAVAEGINSRGSHILATSNLQWYYFSGAYNPSSFADTNPHGSLELTDLDSSWDHIEETGFLQDSGYFNRYYLVGVLWAGYRLIDSYIQINPHDLWVGVIGYSPIISQNRFDDGWWDSVHLISSNTAIHVTNNFFLGYCTSPTLNPANFPTNPGGITTDLNCSAIESFNLGSTIALNTFEELGAIWPFWAIGDVWAGPNAIGGVPSVIDQPDSNIIGNIGGDGTANNASDASRSLYNLTATIGGAGLSGGGGPNIPLTNVGLGGTHFSHYFLNDSTTANYTGFTGGIADTYLTISVGPHSTITPSATIFTCTGKPIIGRASTAASRDNTHWFWNNSGSLLEEICPSGLSGSNQTTVNCSSSGTAVFAQPFSGPGYSSISIQSVACSGTASYTYPNAFTYTPSAGGAKSAFATTISTTAVTVTGDGTSGFLKLEALQ
jgi:hypothetical protein